MQALIDYSRKYGADPELVIAGGGNTSMKENGVLYVKRSGCPLSQADRNSFVALDISKLLALTEKEYPRTDSEREAAFLADVMAARLPGEDGRPSVEALLHALFPQRYILHLHPTLVNALTCSVEGSAAAKRLFGDRALWVPVCRPGYTLGVTMAKHLTAETEIALLQNHGVFFAADTAEKLHEQLAWMLDILRGAVPAIPAAAYTDPVVNDSPLALSFAQSRESAAPILLPFTPDQIVYSGARPRYFESEGEWDGKGAAVIKGKGFMTETAVGMQVFTDAAKIAAFSAAFGGAQPLPDELISFIVGWEAESYRKSVH